MKKLDEKLSLFRLAEAFGVAPDPKLLEEIKTLQGQQERLKARVHAASQALFEAPAKEYKRPSTYPDGKAIPAQLPDLYQPATNPGVPKNQRCDNCEYYVAESKKCTRWNNAVVKPAYWCAKWDPIVAKKAVKEEPETAVDVVSKYIKESTVVGPEPVLAQPSNNLELKLKQLEKWVSRIAATGPGGGEVNLRWLDDVDRSNISDGQYLRYDGPTKKFTFDAGFHNNFSASFASHYTQTSNATSATAILLDVSDWSFGISNGTNTSRITIANPGLYNVQFSLQFKNNSTAAESAWVWMRKNGLDVSHTNSKFTVPARVNANEASAIIGALNLFVNTSSVGEYVELYWWASNNSALVLEYNSSIAATASRPFLPEVPSVIVTVSPVKVDSY